MSEAARLKIRRHVRRIYLHVFAEFCILIFVRRSERQLNTKIFRRIHVVASDPRGTAFLHEAVVARQCKVVGNIEAAPVQHQNRKSLGCRIDGSGKARRPRADDGDVIEPVRIDRANQSNATRQIGLAGITQDLSARTYDERQLSRIAASRSRSTSPFSERPMITGPPTPAWSICVRRKISARISRSPSSASAISKARIRSGEKINASTGSVTMPSPNEGRPASCASSPTNAPGPNV